MSVAGVNCNIFKAHSVRSASISAAFHNDVGIQDSLKVAGWKNGLEKCKDIWAVLQ